LGVGDSVGPGTLYIMQSFRRKKALRILMYNIA
jgi:hypothetical protein